MEKKTPPPKPPRLTKTGHSKKLSSSPSRLSPPSPKMITSSLGRPNSAIRGQRNSFRPNNEIAPVSFDSKSRSRHKTEYVEGNLRNKNLSLITDSKRLSFPNFESIDRRHLVASSVMVTPAYDNIVEELNSKTRILKSVNDDSSRQTDPALLDGESEVRPKQQEGRSITRHRSRSVDMLDSPHESPTRSPTSTYQSLHRSKGKESLKGCRTFFPVEDERPHFMEEKPFLSKFAKDVADSAGAWVSPLSLEGSASLLASPSTDSEFDFPEVRVFGGQKLILFNKYLVCSILALLAIEIYNCFAFLSIAEQCQFISLKLNNKSSANI